MKFSNIILLILAIALMQSCNQLETELDNLEMPNTVVADLDLTLTEDDYDLVDKGFGNFNSEEEAKTLIPDILAANYQQLGNGSSAIVCYDLYDPIRINEALDLELTEEDYEALGQDFGTLSRESHIVDAVAYKHPMPEANDVVTLTYEWWCSGCPDQGTQMSKVTYYGGTWYIAYVPTDEDYTFMGQSFPNFESRTTARERIAKILDRDHLFDDSGSIRTAVFTYTYKDDNDERQFEDFMAVFQFDGQVWQPFQDVVEQCLQLGHDGSTWVPDNTVKYSLTADDYNAIVSATADSNPSGSTNLGQYGNFNLDSWSDDQILDAIGNLLLDLFPQTEGQKYLVAYDTYPAGPMDIHLIYKGGEYVKVE